MRALCLLLALLPVARPLCAQEVTVDECDTTAAWSLNATSGRAPGPDQLTAQDGRIRFGYDRGQRLILVHAGELAGLLGLRISLRSEQAAHLGLVVREQDGATWHCSLRLPAGRTAEARIDDPVAQFELNPDSPVQRDRLDPATLAPGFALIDVSDPREAPVGERRNVVTIDRVRVERAARTRVPATRHEWKPIPSACLKPGFPAFPDGPPTAAISDPCLLFDPAENSWKMWFVASWLEDGRPRSMVKHASSLDATAWEVHDGTVLGPAEEAEAWDGGTAFGPAVVLDPDAAADRRYLLFYSATDGRTPGARLGLATSAFGRRFVRLPADQSPHGRAGLVFEPRDAFPAESGATGGSLEDPTVVRVAGQFHLWCAGTAAGANGETLARGIVHLVSADAVHWSAVGENPIPTLGAATPEEAPHHPTVAWNGSRQAFEMWFARGDAAAGADAIAALRFPRFRAVSGCAHARSADGSEWSLAEGLDFTAGGVLLAGADAVRVGDAIRLLVPALAEGAPPVPWFGIAEGR